MMEICLNTSTMNKKISIINNGKGTLGEYHSVMIVIIGVVKLRGKTDKHFELLNYVSHLSFKSKVID